MRDHTASDRVQPASGIAESGPSPSNVAFAKAVEECVIGFLENAFRNIDLPPLSDDDIADIGRALIEFGKPVATGAMPALVGGSSQ